MLRRVIGGGALALLAPLLVLPTAPAASAADDTGEPMPSVPSVSVRITSDQRVRLEALPQIVQQGALVASADAARTAVTATIRPARPGRTVRLQVQHGLRWQSVSVRRQDGRGRAQFAWPATVGDEPLVFRVKAAAAPGLRPFASHAVSAARWLHPTWTDEFTGSELGPAWHHRGGDYSPSSRRSCAKGDPRAVSVGGGAVRLSVLPDLEATTRCRIQGRDSVPGRYAYRLNGHIGTGHAVAFRYGFAAARVKFHRRRGQHGAFWMQPASGIDPLGSEIDVVEYFGDHHPQGGLATFVHRYNARRNVTSGGWIPNHTSYLRSRNDGWSRNYHVFSVEWTPRQVVFRIDGKESARMRGKISQVRQTLILSLLSGDYEIPKIDERRLPQHMYVDWVRVWETAPEDPPAA